MQFCFRLSNIFQSIRPHRRISVLVQNSDGLLSNELLPTFPCCAVLMSKMLKFSFLKFRPSAVKYPYIDKCVCKDDLLKHPYIHFLLSSFRKLLPCSGSISCRCPVQYLSVCKTIFQTGRSQAQGKYLQDIEIQKMISKQTRREN